MSTNNGYVGFADFDIDPTASIVTEFNRLAIQNDWKKHSKQYKEQRSYLVTQEFSAYFGSNFSTLAAWQALCQAVGITDIPSSITQCQKLLKKTYVNIFDLIDAARTGTVARTFPNNKKLAAYTKHGKIFPKEKAKSNLLLKFMLRHIF